MKFHKFMALFLCLCLCVSGFSVSAQAMDLDSILGSVVEAVEAENAVEILPVEAEPIDAAEEVLYSETAAEAVYLNPLYPEAETEAMLANAEPYALMLLDEPPRFTEETFDEAVAYYRDAVKSRASTITLSYTTDDYDKERLFYGEDKQTYANSVIGEIFTAMWNEVTKHTGEPDEGDYILWHFATRKVSAGYSSKGNSDDVTFNMTIGMTYYTDYDMELAFEEEITKVLASLELDGMDDYEKVCTIYDYICDHVTYDHKNLNNESYKLKYTAYAALFNGTAVCQGYASLFYNMALHCGIDARLIPGSAIRASGYKEAHGWNIVQLGDKYYYLDSTWDAGKADYDYFLRGAENFTDHETNPDYAHLFEDYSISATDYVRIVFGDLDASGRLDAGDIVMLMKAIAAGQFEGTEGDLNDDGIVDILDVIKMATMLAA